MSDFKFIQAYVDFESDLTLDEVSKLLSTRIFAGIPFVGKDEGIWDEVPAVRLKHDFLGIRVVLGCGGDEGQDFTLEIEFADFPWDNIPEEKSNNAVCDISAYVKEQLKEICEIELIE